MNKKTLKNTTALYAMNMVKLILPLVTLPYLTRVLTKDCYGTVSYVKAIMQYVQIVVDFGFLLSATKDIVNAKNNKDSIAKIIGDTLLAKVILVLISFALLMIFTCFMPLLKHNIIFTILSFGTVAMTIFLMDFLFRGLEEMQVITIRYVVMRGLATVLTFTFVKSDKDILWIPLLDIIGSAVAIALVWYEIRKRNFYLYFTSLKDALLKLKESGVYFLSNMATTTFTALNTLIIGMSLKVTDVANWSVCMQMVSAVQSMYSPITDGIYPHMVKTKDLRLVRKIERRFMVIVTAGCLFTFFFAKYALLILGGEKYLDAVPLLRAFIPLLFVSFPAMLYGWPTLGAINKVKETTITTIITAILQILGIFLLFMFREFNVVNLALLRGGTEFCMFILRFGYCQKYKSDFIS